MGGKVNWASEVRSVCLLVLLSALLGWFAGHSLLFVTLCLLVILFYFLLQLRRMHSWLSSPEQAPPESRGLWGDIFDKMYALQRQNLEAHSQLQSTVDYLRDSFSSMRDGVVILDSTGIITWSNDAAETLLGLRYPADKGQGILNLVRAPEFHQYFINEDYTAPLKLETNSNPALFLRMEFTCFGQGDRLMFIRDISKTHHLEQMRKDFVANVSHELRTPLTVISGYLGTMLSAQDSIEPHFRKPLQQMEQQAQRMESLLKDLLWLSRLESIEQVESGEVVDMAGLLQELQAELKSSYPERDIELVLETQHKVAGDHRELYSAVSNLVINALKYSPDDSPVCICWSPLDDKYVLSIIDQGVGIAATHIPRLTERFYRVDDSRSSASGGTGLGLAIVKHVAARHTAELRIESVVGLGSKFILIFS